MDAFEKDSSESLSNAERVSRALASAVVEECVKSVASVLSKAGGVETEVGREPNLQSVSVWFQGLSAPDRKNCQALLQVVAVDTVAALLGLLDGICGSSHVTDDFSLYIGEPASHRIDGCLTDFFLAEVQEREGRHRPQ